MKIGYLGRIPVAFSKRKMDATTLQACNSEKILPLLGVRESGQGVNT